MTGLIVAIFKSYLFVVSVVLVLRGRGGLVLF